ncbi:MAG: AAA family ATPase [Candidatus Krumholzibacteriia bacterium]
MRVMALVNQKGGCGKTTVAANLAAALSRLDLRVLLIDNDPQGHAGLAFGFRESDFALSTYDLYLTGDIRVEDAALEVAPRLHLVPAGVELSAVEAALAGVPGREERLLRCLRRSKRCYDWVLLDCPPGVGMLTFNALLCCDEALVPVDASHQSLQAVARLRDTLTVLHDQKRHEVTPRLLLSNVDMRLRYVHDLVQELEAHHGDALLETIIHPTVRLKEAFRAGRSIFDHDPASRAALDFRRLADEICAGDAEVRAHESERWAALPPGPAVTGDEVLFVADFPAARSVSITGTFCGWSPAGLELARRPDGLWERRVPVPPGAHEYLYMVDGVWLADPHNAAVVANEFGGENSVLTVLGASICGNVPV